MNNVKAALLLVLGLPFIIIGFIAYGIKDAIVFGWEFHAALAERHAPEPQATDDGPPSWLHGPSLTDLTPGPRSYVDHRDGVEHFPDGTLDRAVDLSNDDDPFEGRLYPSSTYPAGWAEIEGGEEDDPDDPVTHG